MECSWRIFHASAFVLARASAYVCVRASTCVRLRASGRAQKIKRPEASRPKRISASRRVFCSRTLERTICVGGFPPSSAQPHESAARPLQKAHATSKGHAPLLILVAAIGNKPINFISTIMVTWSLIIHEQNQPIADWRFSYLNLLNVITVYMLQPDFKPLKPFNRIISWSVGSKNGPVYTKSKSGSISRCAWSKSGPAHALDGLPPRARGQRSFRCTDKIYWKEAAKQSRNKDLSKWNHFAMYNWKLVNQLKTWLTGL